MGNRGVHSTIPRLKVLVEGVSCSGWGAGCRQYEPETDASKQDQETGRGKVKQIGGRSVAVIAVANAVSGVGVVLS